VIDLLSIIILAGEADSGKSKTLHAMLDKHGASIRPHIYSLKGKRAYISFSSPQEYPKVKFCDSEKVSAIVGKWIGKCETEACTMLITTFQIRTKQKDGRLNEDCIEKPIDDLKSRFKAYVVYLRKNGSRTTSPRVDKDRLKRINDLMRRLKNHEIETCEGNEKKQANDLWNFIMKVDP
jgi:hypothetical protein